MPIDIRPAQLSDFSAICDLNRTALGYDTPAADTRRRLERMLELPGNRIFVAEHGGAVVGYVHAADYECSYMEPLKNIMAIAVDEGSRGLGAGRALLAAAERWARETGAGGVRLVSSSYRTGAHAFYLACGYAVRKEQKNFIKFFDR